MVSGRRLFLAQTSAACGMALAPFSRQAFAQAPELAVLTDFIHRFMKEQQAPGVALAVTYQSRLVYAQGFGLAAAEHREYVQADSLFRIASISKAITATAIMQLVERGQLTLDAKVWEVLRLAEPKDVRWKAITITHLLNHTSGWDRDKFDLLGADALVGRELGIKLPVSKEHLIQYMLRRPLQYAPGTQWGYSNFSFVLLGRVIERISGRSYEDYVRVNMLAPLGIRRMRIGQTLQRAEGEVEYFADDGKKVPAVVGEIGEPALIPYGAWHLANFDAAGGWIGSAIDVARFAAAFDNPKACPILSERSIAAMVARDSGPAGEIVDGNYVGLGWFVWPGEPFAHGAQASATGLIGGTSTYLMRRRDGVNWVVLFNKRSGPDGKPLMIKFRDESALAFNAVKRWPEGDLFRK